MGTMRLTKAQRLMVEQAAANIAAVLAGDTPQGHKYWYQVRENLHQIYDDTAPLDALPRDERMTKYGSPNLRPGYQTILGFLASRNDERLSADPQDTVRDGQWLSRACKLRGYRCYIVPAPHVFHNTGVRTVNAYPEHMLRKRFLKGTKAGEAKRAAEFNRQEAAEHEKKVWHVGLQRYVSPTEKGAPNPDDQYRPGPGSGSHHGYVPETTDDQYHTGVFKDHTEAEDNARKWAGPGSGRFRYSVTGKNAWED